MGEAPVADGRQQQPRSKSTPFWVGPIPTPQLGLKWPLWEPLNGSFMKAVLAEFAAMTAFLLITIGHVTFSCHASNVGLGAPITGGEVADPTSCLLTDARLLSIATVFGLSIGALVYATASFSGGHLNPAVTLGFLIARKISLQRAFCYWIAQMLGAIFGSLFPWLIDRVAWHAAGGGANGIGVATIHESAIWGMETLLTAVLVFVVFCATDSKRSAVGPHLPVLAPFAIGFTVFICHLIAIPIDGCSINPARSFGPAVIGGLWAHQWIFWVGPMCGGVLGAVLYELIFRMTRKTELALYSADSMPAHMHEGNNQTAHLADFSGFKGRDDHAVPAPDEATLPAYSGVKGATGGRYRGDSASGATEEGAPLQYRPDEAV
jgi:MIP family channel proteins